MGWKHGRLESNCKVALAEQLPVQARDGMETLPNFRPPSPYPQVSDPSKPVMGWKRRMQALNVTRQDEVSYPLKPVMGWKLEAVGVLEFRHLLGQLPVEARDGMETGR